MPFRAAGNAPSHNTAARVISPSSHRTTTVCKTSQLQNSSRELEEETSPLKGRAFKSGGSHQATRFEKPFLLGKTTQYADQAPLFWIPHTYQKVKNYLQTISSYLKLHTALTGVSLSVLLATSRHITPSTAKMVNAETPKGPRTPISSNPKSMKTKIYLRNRHWAIHTLYKQAPTVFHTSSCTSRAAIHAGSAQVSLRNFS